MRLAEASCALQLRKRSASTSRAKADVGWWRLG
jgi:hypothetical protein